jgi:hypothetical protein
MTATPNNPNSLFPDLPRETPAVTADGNFSFLWALGFASLFQALQKNFSNEGVVFPNLSASDIALILGRYTPYIGQPLPNNLPDISGQTVFDTDNRVSKQFVITYNATNPPTINTVAWKQFVYL